MRKVPNGVQHQIRVHAPHKYLFTMNMNLRLLDIWEQTAHDVNSFSFELHDGIVPALHKKYLLFFLLFFCPVGAGTVLNIFH